MQKKYEYIKLLKSEILSLTEKITGLETKLFLKLEKQAKRRSIPEEEIITISYYISGIYSFYEDLFQKIANTFENTISDKTMWHSELLNRMSLTIENIRPKVISPENLEILNELRRFRHVFRYSYSFELKWEKIKELATNWKNYSKRIKDDIDCFIKFLDEFK